MPGFLGGSSGSGVGGEIRFPAELIDPVTKLRVSEPQTLIDTDFEYGLQPTKWETVELINNTPSFFSKSGDTTIPNIEAITTTATSREIKVTTGLPHGLAVGIPINVSGTKSLTADGSYIINSVPTATTFTYLCKQNQPDAQSIEDLYTSIITGEFFQGSQIKIADSDGIVTDAVSNPSSTLTVKTESPHGFGLNTPFYFLNLNSTVSQEFDSSNTSSKAFDSSNSATAQVFDGSNTLTSYRLDLDNNAVSTGTVSPISTYNPTLNTITVSHTTENFIGAPVGTPLYHNITTAGGYFASNPRGVVFLRSLDTATTNGSIFTVSLVPNGTVIPITNALTGTFQRANEARTFPGNNINPISRANLTVESATPRVIDGANDLGVLATVSSYSGSLVTVTADSGIPNLGWYPNAMLLYTTTGTAASGLTNNTTYWIDTVNQSGSSSTFLITIKATPTGSAITSISGGTGTQKFRTIGVSPDKDFICLNNHGFIIGDMLKYEYPSGGRFTSDTSANYFFVDEIANTHNFKVGLTKGGLVIPDGSTAAKAALSGQALVNTNTQYSLGLTTGFYWIQTQAMKNANFPAIQMLVDFTQEGGGYDFFFVNGWGINTANIRDTNVAINSSGQAIPGLQLCAPRSPQWWVAAANAVRLYRPGGAAADYFASTYGVWGVNSGGNYSTSAGDGTPFRDSRFYGSGRSTSTHRSIDNGRWWLRNSGFSEPNGDYTAGQTYGGYGFPGVYLGQSEAAYSGQDIGFNDGTSGYPLGGYYLISTNAKP
jgi:hypothetical protein